MKAPANNAKAGEWRWWIVGLAILLRASMGIQRHSGQGKPPMHGDYEAQRHWMEITTNLPLSQWYVNSTTNDLMYWGIDYPPLSAYQSWIHGQMMATVEPASVELGTSRGYETPSSKMVLRWTVLLSDILIFFPACLAVGKLLPSGSAPRILVDLLLSPALVLIDHGHFQYNCINLGLAIGATAMTLKGQFVLGATLFVAALNHKQMLLYYSPAFFAYMLGTCLQQQFVSRKIAATVVMSFALIWAPFVLSPTGALAVVRRIFPSSRGLFEDYVANAWCISSLIIKWRRLFSQQQLLVLCTLSTFAAFLPSMLCTLLRPSRRAFLLGLANSSMAFFLFSYQVHEKSILLPLMAIAMHEEPGIGEISQYAAVFSMLPLLRKDGLVTAVVATCLVYAGAVRLLQQAEGDQRDAVSSTRLVAIFCGGGVCIMTGFSLFPAPARYPFLEDAAIMVWSCTAFFAIFAYTNWLQLQEYKKKT